MNKLEIAIATLYSENGFVKEKKIRKYMAQIAKGEELPPEIVHQCYVSQRNYLCDGNHKARAKLRMGITTLDTTVRPCFVQGCTTDACFPFNKNILEVKIRK